MNESISYKRGKAWRFDYTRKRQAAKAMLPYRKLAYHEIEEAIQCLQGKAICLNSQERAREREYAELWIRNGNIPKGRLTFKLCCDLLGFEHEMLSDAIFKVGPTRVLDGLKDWIEKDGRYIRYNGRDLKRAV